MQVLLARGVPALDAETLVTRGVAGGDQHVVDSRRVVLLEREDRAPPVRDELLAGPREQPVDDRARVLRAVVLAGVLGDERPGVRDLPAIDVDHAKATTRINPHGTPLARRDVDGLRDGAIIRGARRAPPVTTSDGVTGRPCTSRAEARRLERWLG